MDSVSKKISFLRQKGLRVSDIINTIGISRQFLSQIKTGKRKMPLDKQIMLDEMLATTASSVVVFNNDVSKKIPIIKAHTLINFDPSISTFDDLLEQCDDFIIYNWDVSENVFAIRINCEDMMPWLRPGVILLVCCGVAPKKCLYCVANHKTDGIIVRRWAGDKDKVRLLASNSNAKSYEWTYVQYMTERPLVWMFEVETVLDRKIHTLSQ